MLSIIIPTTDRKDLLAKTLEGLLRCSFPEEYEVIVVDRPMDKTYQLIESLAGRYPIRYIEHHGQGRSSARNLGIKASEGEFLLFLDDDILVNEDFIEEHTRYHKEFPKDACLGKTINRTDSKDPFVEYLVNHSTFITAYSLIKDPDDTPFNFFYTANISLKKEEMIKIGLFNEDFSGYGLEDIEFGYRWVKSGRKIRYNTSAIGYHYYDTTRDSFLTRRYQVGQAAALLYRRHNGLDLREYLNIDVASKLTEESELIIKKARRIIEILEGLPFNKDIFGSKGIREALYSLYSLLIAYYYYHGLRDGLNARD